MVNGTQTTATEIMVNGMQTTATEIIVNGMQTTATEIMVNGMQTTATEIMTNGMILVNGITDVDEVTVEPMVEVETVDEAQGEATEMDGSLRKNRKLLTRNRKRIQTNLPRLHRC
eukprot:GHVT01091619.1.p2 GENE.GHVT01091619.1~~GHVT01091619.1.p2  ORF type:complete len:115 (-),score=11.35 GHVT01091619.1:204-548(-)